MPGRRLSVDQPVSLNGGFLRVALALNYDARVQTPHWRFLLRVAPENIRKQAFQQFVALELAFDLSKERFADGLGVREQAHRDFWAFQNLLDDSGKRDDRRLIVLTRPQV